MIVHRTSSGKKVRSHGVAYNITIIINIFLYQARMDTMHLLFYTTINIEYRKHY